MTIIEFPYCRSTPTSTKNICDCNDPYITVTLCNAGFEVPVEGLVDSGCTLTLVNSEFAEALGIDLSTCSEVPIGGVGAVVQARMAEINLRVQGFNYEFRSPVAFTDNLPVPILLGQLNFFQHFDVHFQKKHHKFTLDDSK